MNFTFFGDWCPGNYEVSIKFQVDVAFLNIEGPVVNRNFDFRKHRLEKLGPHLSSFQAPEFAKNFFFSIANNHIMDYGLAGVINTLKILDYPKNPCLGFKLDELDSLVYRLPLGENQFLSIISTAEKQYGYTKNESPGYFARFEHLNSIISEAKAQNDIVVVSIHGGDEQALVPSFYRRDLYRSYIESGATVIWGHHSHLPQGWEYWNEGLILYGLGNFVSDPRLISHAGLGRYSLVADINLYDIKKAEFSITKQEVQNGQIAITKELLSDSQYENYFSKVNLMLTEDEKMRKYWDMYSQKMFRSFYGKIITNFSRRQLLINRLKHILSKIKNKGFSRFEESQKLLFEHVNACESHRETIKYYIDRRTQFSRKDMRIMRQNHKKLSQTHLI
jgi:poly-gamma-glutamate synthesis protein (capsule biosynthesis protein)